MREAASDATRAAFPPQALDPERNDDDLFITTPIYHRTPMTQGDVEHCRAAWQHQDHGLEALPHAADLFTRRAKNTKPISMGSHPLTHAVDAIDLDLGRLEGERHRTELVGLARHRRKVTRACKFAHLA